ncbi:hypothetical protein Btru_014768, partial [Bulinus truncatus]
MFDHDNNRKLQSRSEVANCGTAQQVWTAQPTLFHQPISNFKTGAGQKWTLRFLGNLQYGLTVLMEERVRMTATFVAIPVDSWGKIYYAVTLRKSPYLVIIAFEEADVILDLRRYSSVTNSLMQLTINLLKVIMNGTDKITLSLERYGAVDISGCSNSTSSLSGTNIVSNEPIGVVSGSCGGRLYQPAENCSKERILSDLAAEMLAPHETYGRVFITPVLTLRLSSGSLLVVASQPDTLVRYIDDRGESKDVTLTQSGNVIRLPASHWVSGTKPIAVYYIQRSGCDPTSSSTDETDNELGEASLSLVVPVELFYFKYVFIVPSVAGAENYIIMVINNVRRRTLVLDGNYLSSQLIWDKALGTHSYTQGGMAITEGVHRLATVDFSAFGCYLYGLKLSHSYMHPVGFRTSRINTDCEERLKIPNRPGDLIDSDCYHGDDDEDKDGHIDEIFGGGGTNGNPDSGIFVGLPDRQGILEVWGPWHCAQDCSEYRLVRTRKCLPVEQGRRPVCKEQLLEYGFENACYTDTLCPGQCPSYTWGPNCLRNCSRCYQPCNKFNGTCRRCKAGFKGAKQGCNLTCDQFEFGQDCLGNCLTKCDGEDCLDRVTGECS